MALAGIAAHRLGGILPVGIIFKASAKIGENRAKRRGGSGGKSQSKDPLQIFQVKEAGCSSMEQRTNRP
jgi:hypothetical protein